MFLLSVLFTVPSLLVPLHSSLRFKTFLDYLFFTVTQILFNGVSLFVNFKFIKKSVSVLSDWLTKSRKTKEKR
jgi:hypothetical protein